MEILIFSAGRSERQITLEQIAALHPRIVVQAEQAKEYEQHGFGAYLLKLPPTTPKTLPAARAWAARKYAGQKVLMLDDDLTFAERRRDDPTKFLTASPSSCRKMITAIEKALDKFAHVGVCSREGGNRVTTDQQATRMSRVLAYNLATVPKDVQFDRVLLPEDFDVTLQLLYHGLPNLVLSGWCHNQPGSNTDGGCSVYRTIDVHNEAMVAFGKLHPGIVKIVEKQTKTSWGGQARLDAVVQWKKALEMGRGK